MNCPDCDIPMARTVDGPVTRTSCPCGWVGPTWTDPGYRPPDAFVPSPYRAMVSDAGTLEETKREEAQRVRREKEAKEAAARVKCSPVYPDRVCRRLACGETFTPRSGNQLACPACIKLVADQGAITRAVNRATRDRAKLGHPGRRRAA